MNEFPLRLSIAAILAAAIAFAAVRARSLAPSGAIAAVVVGAAIVTGGGWWAGFMLVAFFATSSALSRIARGRTDQAQVRGSRRDAVQVLANGSVATIAALTMPLLATDFATLAFAAVCGALATATADTWATEIGRGSTRPPISIATGKPVTPGVSGGITPRGTFGALAGAALIALLAGAGVRLDLIPSVGSIAPLTLVVVTLAAGFLGSIVDSVLGATIQTSYRCSVCGACTEQHHHCDRATIRSKGLRAVNNDAVNWLATAAGAGSSIVLAAALG
ncbi:MAG: DUF92 domain-containing protein [Thermomicrobiales bacterium]|nr:DUF92 domain-containing protein [Thermomicrobiales bacterium]